MSGAWDRPRIGITTGTAAGWRSGGKSYVPYARAVARAGGRPVALGPGRRGRLEECDGILASGGGDIHPSCYGPRAEDERLPPDELVKKYSMSCDEARDSCELPLVAAALRSGMPVLAICRGIQTVNVVLGGTLVPDIAACAGSATPHRSGAAGQAAWHDVEIDPASALFRILGRTVLAVNSYHHQGVLARHVAPGLRPAAAAPDGVIEAVEGTEHPWLVAVQWHPERARDRSIYLACLPLFQEFVRAAQNRRAARHTEEMV